MNNKKTSLSHCFRGLFCCAALLCLNACGKSPEVLVPAGLLEVPYAIQSMAWHPNGKLLAVGYFNHDEVEVWDIKNKKSLFVIPSKRRPGNSSGQELLFSADGKHLVAQEFLDTKKGEPRSPRMFKEPEESAAQKDRERYILARIVDVQSGKELAQIKGPSSSLHGGAHEGMCQFAGSPNLIALLRGAVISVYKVDDGTFQYDINLRFPFSGHPETGWGYEKMSCSTSRPEISLLGGQMMRHAHLFGFSQDSGATPIVVVDMERQAIKKVLFNPAPLNGIAYTADGSKLVSFGASPTRVWDANNGFALAGEMANPPEVEWVQKQVFPVDELDPPKDAPRGNAGDLTAVPGSSLMIGLASALHFWDTARLRVVATALAPRETLRIAMHAPENTLAVAELNRVHFYRFNAAALPLTAKEK